MDSESKRKKDLINAAICSNGKCYRKRPCISGTYPSSKHSYHLNRMYSSSNRHRLDPSLHRLPPHRHFLYPQYHRCTWTQIMAPKCPKVTLHAFQSTREPAEPSGESEQKNLPAYYYQASAQVKARSRSAAARRKKKDEITSPKAFACAANNEPLYSPEDETPEKLLILVEPELGFSKDRVIFDPYFKFLDYPF